MTPARGFSSFTARDGRCDLDLRGRLIEGRRLAAEAVLKRWLTPRGSLFWNPDFGHDVRQYLSMRLDAGRLYAVGIALAAEAEKDERIASAEVSVEALGSGATRRLRIVAKLVDAEGPFELVSEISLAKVELFKVAA